MGRASVYAWLRRDMPARPLGGLILSILLNGVLLRPVTLPERRQPIHLVPRERRNTSSIVFLTVCTKGRKPVLADEVIHQCLLDAWNLADEWLVGRYVIMPDHLHLFCASVTVESCPLARWVQFWKSRVTRDLPGQKRGQLWQSSYWDRQLRSSDSYSEKWNYVRENPVRGGLVVRAKDWAYQGEIHPFRFRDSC